MEERTWRGQLTPLRSCTHCGHSGGEGEEGQVFGAPDGVGSTVDAEVHTRGGLGQ